MYSHQIRYLIILLPKHTHIIPPLQVEVWEGALTLLFFVILIIASYLADIKVCNKFAKKRNETETVDLANELKNIDSKKLIMF